MRLFLLALVIAALSSCAAPHSTGRAALIRSAAPAPTKKVNLQPLKDDARETEAAIRRARDEAVRAREQAEEAKSLNDAHLDTIHRLSEKLEENEEVQQDLSRLKEEAHEYRSLDDRRVQVIENLRSALEVAREKLEQIRLTHVPRAELDAATSELEKEKLRQLTNTAADVVEDVELDIAKSNESAARYKSHYDSRWGRYFKIAGVFFTLGIASVFVIKWLLKAGIISLSGGTLR